MGMRSTLNIDDVVVHEESSQTVAGRKEERSKGKHDCDTLLRMLGPPLLLSVLLKMSVLPLTKLFLIKV
jgi:hypothetical protein